MGPRCRIPENDGLAHQHAAVDHPVERVLHHADRKRLIQVARVLMPNQRT